jgi:hypothetical protein
MEEKKTGLSISAYFGICFVLTFIIVSTLVVMVVDRQMRNEALLDAREKTGILLERNLATHHYFSQELKPILFDAIEGSKSKDYFEPVWMSSTYAIRQIDKYFNAFDEYGDYYYKECAVNARSPQNEADDYEKAFIEELNTKPDLLTRSEIRTIDDVDYFVTLRRGEMMDESCLRCHSTPANAPGDLVAQYGPQRSFNRNVGDAVSVISVRVPLAKAYMATRAASVKLSILILAILGLMFSALYYFTKKLVLKPLRIIEKKSHEISFDPERLGDKIPLPFGKELCEMVTAFNNMSVKLRDNRDHLEQKILHRTNQLEDLNQQLVTKVNERKNAENEIRKAKEFLDNVINAQVDTFFVFEPETGKAIRWNENFSKISGYTDEEISAMKAPDSYYSQDDLEKAKEGLKKLEETGSATVEMSLITKEGKTIPFEYTASLIETTDGRNFAISMGRDITERKEAENALKTQRYYLAKAQEIGSIGTWDMNIVKNELIWTDECYRIFGVDIGMPLTYESFANCIHLDDRDYVDKEFSAALNGKPYDIEHRIVVDGEIRWVREKAEIESDEHGKGIRAVGFTQDITARKDAEEKLKESEEKFRLLSESSPTGVFYTDKEGKVLYTNPAWQKITGFSLDESLDFKWADALYYEDKPNVLEDWADCLKKGTGYTGEFRFIDKKGNIKWVYTTTSPIKTRDGRIVGHVGSNQDITARKGMESRQLLTREILKRINRDDEHLDIIRDVLMLIKQSIGFEAVGIRLQEGNDFPYFVVNGFSAEFIKAENYLCTQDENSKQICDSQGNPFLECMCGNVLSERTDPALPFFTEGGSFWTNNTTMLLASTSEQERQGRTRNYCNKVGYESVALIPLRSSDQIVGLLQLNDTREGQFTPEMISFFEGICASIGIGLARIKAEKERENLAKFPSENPNSVLRIAEDGTVIYANKASSVVLETWKCTVGERIPEPCRTRLKDAFNVREITYFEFTCHDGQILSVTIAPVKEAGYANIYGLDITERKQAEIALQQARDELEMRVQERTEVLNNTVGVLQEEIDHRMRAEETLGKSEEKYRELVENANSIIMRRNIKGEITFFNEFAQKFFGYSQEEIIGLNVIGTIIPETDSSGRDQKAMVRDIGKHPDKYHNNENENMRRNGERIWITWTNKPIRNEEGKIVEILAIGSDTTERREQEKVLQESEARLADAQRIAHIGNWEWNIVEDRVQWSAETYRIFGVKSREFHASYENFFLCVHPDDREFVKQSLKKALRNHKSFSITHRIILTDGSEKIVHEQFEIIRDADKNPVRIRGTVQDVTSQKLAEKKILDNQKKLRSLTAELLLSEERERRKIAENLHDSIGQILAFSDRELGILQKSIPNKLSRSVEEIRHHIKHAVKETRTLTFDLSPPVLYDIGFEAAVEDLVEQFSREKNIECLFENRNEHKPIADHIKIFLYRSIRELLVNAVKHSNAKLVQVTSSGVKNDILITVEDDGTGFDISKFRDKPGYSNSFGLFSIRERLTHMNGRLDIQSGNGNGTKITLQVPLKYKSTRKGKSGYEH